MKNFEQLIYEYKGDALGERSKALLQKLSDQNFRFTDDGKTGVVISIWKDGRKFGYIDRNVAKAGGAVGYNFWRHGSDANHGPHAWASNVVAPIAKFYGFSPSYFEGRRSKDKYYLTIMSVDSALTIVNSDYEFFVKGSEFGVKS